MPDPKPSFIIGPTSKASIDSINSTGTIQSTYDSLGTGLVVSLIDSKPPKIGGPAELDIQPQGGNVVMFSPDAKADLTVNGPANVAGDINVLDSHNIVVHGGDVILSGGDCAEDFDIAHQENVEAGTVMVINEEGELQESRQAYDKKVAGIISGAGNLRPGVILGKQPSKRGRMPLALVGKVYCKVDADCSPIGVGDLLTTSPTIGHAMKAKDQAMAFGAVIGKALKGLDSGKGLIPILAALQ